MTARAVILTTMRSLLGMGPVAYGAVQEPRPPYGDPPETLEGWLAWHIEHDGEMVTAEEAEQVRELMRRIRDRGALGAAGGVQVETD